MEDLKNSPRPQKRENFFQDTSHFLHIRFSYLLFPLLLKMFAGYRHWFCCCCCLAVAYCFAVSLVIINLKSFQSICIFSCLSLCLISQCLFKITRLQFVSSSRRKSLLEHSTASSSSSSSSRSRKEEKKELHAFTFA